MHEEGELVFDESDQLELDETEPRWIGTGRTVLDNKGNVIKQYEPYFSDTEEYENEDDIVESGVTPIFHYDPLGRLIRTDRPDGAYSRVEFTPWTQKTWDENDTVLEAGNIWYEERDPPEEEPYTADQRAAKLTEAHA